MVIIRESPHAKLSPSKNDTQWPPKSPFQALLSSPTGRKKWQDHKTRSRERSTSPSPVKRPMGSSKALREAVSGASDDEDVEDEEDEETLQLQLQAIQAKLKLKKLRQRGTIGGSESVGGKESGARASSRADTVFASPTKSSIARPRPDVEVPLSPTKDRNIPPEEHPSPARQRLGLSAAFKAQDVSLKRARDGTQLPRPHSDTRNSARRSDHVSGSPKPKSFSERLAQSKAASQDHQAKHERLEKTRSKGFGSNQTTTTKSTTSKPNGAAQRGTRDADRPSSSPRRQTASRSETSTDTQARSDTSTSLDPHNPSENQDSPGYDPFSALHLSKRHISHSTVTRSMADKEIYTLPRLLKEVKAPSYDPPDCDADFVVFAILASKSSPFDQKAAHRTADEHHAQEDADKPRNKFMVLHLCDLKWEVDCFLFGTAFDQFWKLTEGTLLAILNPGIMPPKGNQNSGRFSLKLGSSEDCVMEIGLARDLGYCGSVKKDGQLCGAWVDKRSTEVCEFHLSLMVDRERKHRMEVNTMWRSHEDGAEKKHRPNSHSREAGAFDSRMNGNKKTPLGASYHREYGQIYSVPSGYAKSAASLLDAEDTVTLSAEASRKRIAAAQRERDLRKRLGEIGSGVGAEYMRADRTGSHNTNAETSSRSTDHGGREYFEKPSAASLGLLGKKAAEQRLSPAKDRKKHFGLGAVSSVGTEAMGWGGAGKAGLLRPRKNPASAETVGSPERGQQRLTAIVRGRPEDGGSVSPSKKRARFALEKGIREPGRESLGGLLVGEAGAGPDGDGDDDDLDIV